MLARLPTLADFPSSLKLTITPPPISSPQLTNILILLHGLGDTLTSFTKLGTKLNLPETTSISLQAPTPLPFDSAGFHWGDDIQFDSVTGQMHSDTGFSKVCELLRKEIIEVGLVQTCGYSPRNIMLFGFGQGAMAALATASSIPQELGGIISIGGPLPISDKALTDVKSPVLLLGGSSNTSITRTAVERIKSTFQDVEYHKWNKANDHFPQSREEMLPIMRFFARRLRSRKGVPLGSVEIA